MTYNCYTMSKETRRELRKEAAKATVKRTAERIGIFCWCAQHAFATAFVGFLLFGCLFFLPAFFH